MKTKIGIPIGLALVMFLGVFTAMLALGVIAPTGVQGADQPVNTGVSTPSQQTTTPTATRSFDMSRVDPGGDVMVTITVANYGRLGSVTETLPAGFTYKSTTHDADQTAHPLDGNSQMVRFTLFGDDSVTYTVTASSTVGDYTFSGTLRDEETDDHDVGGATMVMVSTMSVPGAPTGLEAMAYGQNQINLSWTAPSDNGGADITGYKIEYSMDGSSWSDLMADTGSPDTTYSHMGLMASSMRYYRVSAINSAGTGPASNTAMATTDSSPAVSGFSVNNTVKRPGDVSGFRFTFTTTEDLVANEDSITIHFDKDFKGHGSNLSMNHVTVSARHDTDATIADSATIRQTGAYNPSTDATKDLLATANSISHTPAGLTNSNVLGNIEYLISVPDMNGGEDGAPGIAAGSMVTVTISPAADITNATEGGEKGPLGVYTSEQPQLVHGKVLIVRGIGLDDYDANRGKDLTVIGRGFQNGTTAAVYLVKTDRGCDFDLDNIPDGATQLVTEPVASDDTFQARFTVTVPPFSPGFGNCIYAEDGNQPPFKAGPVEFELEGLLTVSPKSAAVGDNVDITLEDWPNDTVDYGDITIAGEPQMIVGGSVAVTNGSANFQIEISTGTPSGTDEIKVTTARENDTKTITISGADLSASPTTAVPNQAITVNGQGFTGDTGTINKAGDGSEVSLGGDGAALGSGDRNFNNGESITVDSGGSWSATIIIPITDATTTPGTHELEVTDSGNRSGSVEITIPERELTIEPAEARPGETVTLTGSGFPATNTRSKEHPTPPIEITYGGELVGTDIPDAEGKITLNFRVPLEAAIPSTNRVEANYDLPDGSTVETFVNHEIPGARVSLSMDEGKPGDRVTITGDGFKAFASVEYVRIGGIEVTPAPRPATDRNGEFTATILVPDLAEGTNSIEVKVGVTAHANFKVLDTEAPRMMMPEAEDATPAEAFADLMAEDNLVRVYHFNKHEQTDPDTGGWSLYDTREAFMSLNSIEMIEAGEFYWLMVNNEQLNVELGSERVDLVAGWNQIRW